MTLAKVCSGLVAFGLALGATSAQQPPGKDVTPKPQQKAPPKPPTDELEAAIAASANHPDVRLAQAKLQMAQAELDQAKLQVAQRLAATHAKLRSAQSHVEIEAQSYQRLRQLKAQAAVPDTEVQAAERALAQAKTALAAAEAEWQAARGQAPGRAAATKDAHTAATALSRMLLAEHVGPPPEMLLRYMELANRTVVPVPGSVADRLRELVGKRVRLEHKAPIPFHEAMNELAKTAGFGDLTVRSPEWAGEGRLGNPPKVGPLVGEQTVATWFQLILDDFNRSLVAGNYPSEYYKGPHEVYVRDYGLLITKTELAPQGAPTLAEFARQAQKDATSKPVPKK